MTRLEGKVALVTGGANGIGEAICRQLHKEGAKVVIADISFEDASYLAADLSPDGSTALALEVDMSSESQVASLIAATVKWGGRLNILVNNAARFVFAEIAEVTEEGDHFAHLQLFIFFNGISSAGVSKQTKLHGLSSR